MAAAVRPSQAPCHRFERKKLLISSLGNTRKQRVTRESADVYWKGERRLEEAPEIFQYLFPNNAGKQRITRNNAEVYWKQENAFSLWRQVLREIRPEDYESAALTI